MWVAVDRDGREFAYSAKPKRGCYEWVDPEGGNVHMPLGTIQALTGKILTWKSEPLEITNEIIQKICSKR